MDERLRTLSRAALAAPGDHAAGWALVRALDQAGEDVEAWRARCRLAWAGDARVWDELEPWAPGVRSVGNIAACTLPRARLVADDRMVVSLTPTALEAREARTLEPVWTSDEGGLWSYVAGPLLVHCDRSVIVRRLVDGSEVTRWDLPDGERAIVTCISGNHLVAQGQQGRMVVIDLCTGEIVDVRGGGELTGAHRGLVFTSDGPMTRVAHMHGVGAEWEVRGRLSKVLQTDLVLTRREPRELVLVDLLSRAERWVRPLEREPSTIDVACETVVVAATDLQSCRVVIEGFDRSTGAPCWSWESERPGPPVEVHTDAARDVIYVVDGGVGPPRRVQLRALDARSGDRLWSWTDEASSVRARLLATGSAVLLGLYQGDALHVRRFTTT